MLKDEKNFETIARTMKTYLKRHRMREALDYFHSSVYKEIQTNGSVVAFDLVQAIGERLQRLIEFRFRTFNICVQMLIELCSLVSDKELHIIFLAELEKDWKVRKAKKKAIEQDSDDDDNNPDYNEAANSHEIDDFEFEESYCFLAFLEPLKIVLLRMEKGDFSDFLGAMLVIYRHLDLLPLEFLNGYSNPNNDGHRAIVKHKGMKKLCFVLSGYLNFIQTFVNEASVEMKGSSKNDGWKTQANFLLKALIHLFNYPLRYLVLHAPLDYGEEEVDIGEEFETKDIIGQRCDPIGSEGDNTVKEKETLKNESDKYEVHLEDYEDSFDSWKETDFPNSKLYHDYSVQSVRKLSSLYVGLIASLQPNFITLLENEFNFVQQYFPSDDSNDICFTEEKFISGMAVIASVIAFEPEPNFIPLVYRPTYMFRVHLPLIKNLLDDPHAVLVHEKGLKLLERLLKRCDKLDPEFLEYLRRFPIERSLVEIMKFSQNKELRLKACELFNLLMLSLEPRAMIKFLYSLLIQPYQECGVQCLVIGIYKDQILKSPEFHGQNLHRFVRAIIKICQAESNVNSDIFFTAINFLRFAVSYDSKSSNITGFWSIWDTIQEQFLKPLKKKIEEFDAQIKMQLRSLTEEKLKIQSHLTSEEQTNKKKKKKKFSNIKIANAQPDDKPIDFDSEPTIEQKHSQVLAEQQNLELLRSICARLDELVALKNNS